MPATAIYRDETLALRLERDQLIVERQSALDRTGAAAAVLRRRFVRVAAGSALTAAAVLIWSATLVGGFCWKALDTPATRVALFVAIPAAWALAALVGVAAHAAMRRWHQRRYSRFHPSDDAAADLQRLALLPAPATLTAHAADLERASVAAPLTGVALLAPISIHFLVGLLAGSPSQFVEWMAMSAVITGPAHLTLVVCARRYACRLGFMPLLKLHNAGWATLGIVTFVSAVPFALLLLVPPLLTFITGALFIPASFTAFRHLVERERATLSRRR
jgi:hypothetical protein